MFGRTRTRGRDDRRHAVATLGRRGVTVCRPGFSGNAQRVWRQAGPDVGYKPRNKQRNLAQRGASSVGLQHRGPRRQGLLKCTRRDRCRHDSDQVQYYGRKPVESPTAMSSAGSTKCHRASSHFATFIGISLVNRGWRRLADRLSFREAQLSGAEPMDWRG